MKEVSRVRHDGMFPLITPLDERLAFQDIRNCFLCAVMMDPRLRPGLDKKGSAPQRRTDAQFCRHRGEPY